MYLTCDSIWNGDERPAHRDMPPTPSVNVGGEGGRILVGDRATVSDVGDDRCQRSGLVT